MQPFRHRSFTLLWIGGFISYVGSWMQTVAVGALVISDTGSATWAVLVAAGAFLPIGVLSPIGGALADRLPRRPVLMTGNLAAAVTAVLLAIEVAGGHDNPGVLVALVTLQGSVSALIGPFQSAILPDLVPARQFLAATSLNSAQFNLGRIVGPALAGATVAAFGYPVAFVANAVSFLAVVIALIFVRLGPPGGQPSGLLASVRDGFTAARREPSCWAAIGTIAVVAFLASPFIALVPVMAHHLTHGGARAVAQTTAILTTAQGAGAVAGALCLAPLAARLRPRPAAGREPGRAPGGADRLRRVADPLGGHGAAVRGRAGVHRGPVRAHHRGPVAGAAGLPGPGAQLLPGRARGRLPARLARPGAGDRPGRAGLDHRGRRAAAGADHGECGVLETRGGRAITRD